MRNRRDTLKGLLLIVGLFVLVLTGCRAFEPEAVIVNKAPETFIIGAPLEQGGGYFHFHVFWYGLDEDGRVERFVWALTDTTVQDDETADDEEDTRFNPALDATTLEIANWTTKTDSIFNFTIDQGTQPSYDMTLHMVAIDDFGDYDRTPARLYFFSNTLGTPSINFFRLDEGDTIPLAAGVPDTVGYGFPYHVYWSGSTPNVRGYDLEALALVDSVPPMDDGLFGFKWRLLGEIGGNCVPSLTDCWSPREFNQETQDSFSVWVHPNPEIGVMDNLRFNNNGESDSPFDKLLNSGKIDLEVNAIDIAGVEVANFRRPFSFVVNYDPQTVMVVGLDTEHPEDLQEYPYYILLNDPGQTRYPFLPGDRIPDRTYVVVKALARDNPRDRALDPDFGVGITGFVRAERKNFFGGTFSFGTETSDINYEPTWGADGMNGWYADTLGFLTGPSTEFTINMQAVDEHGRRDGSPAALSFDVGFPPCIQCIEILPNSFSTSAYDESVACYELPLEGQPETHERFAGVEEFTVSFAGQGENDLGFVGPAFIAVDKASGFTRTLQDTTGLGAANYLIESRLYRMEILLHGLDDEAERWADPVRRMMAWKYQVDYDCDPFNQIKDGGGNDDIKEVTYGITDDAGGLEVEAGTGVWRVSVDVAVPSLLLQAGPTFYRDTFLFFQIALGDAELADLLFEKTTQQNGHGTIRGIAVDQTICGPTPVRPAQYNYFRKVRPSVAELTPGLTWRDCLLSIYVPGIQDGLSLSQGAMASLDDTPATKEFRITLVTPEGNFECSALADF